MAVSHPSRPAPQRPATFADRLAANRARQFAGRTREQQLWAHALSGETEDFSLLWLTGSGGVGKTTLLNRFEAMASQQGRPVVRLDARHLLGSTTEFLRAFSRQVQDEPNLHANSHFTQYLNHNVYDADLSHLRTALLDLAGVLMVDTAEDLGLLEHWLRDTFLPALPAHWLMVFSGRTPPDAAWLQDLGWREMVRVETLENLDLEAACGFLGTRGIDPQHHQALVSATHGHPLALSLAADVMLLERMSDPRQILQEPDVVTTLLHRFSHNAPDGDHQLALQVAAHVRIATESTLRHALGRQDVSQLYDWLTSLSFTVVGPDGLYLHDLAAEVLDIELRRRDPERYLAMHRSLRQLCLESLKKAVGAEQHSAAADLHWMHRFSPTLSALAEWSSARMLDPAPLRERDRPQVVEATYRLQGEVMGGAMEYWVARQPEAFAIVRDRSGQARGYVCALKLNHADLLDSALAKVDPRVPQLCAHVQAMSPLREGELVSLFSWQDFESSEETAQLLSSVSITFTRTFLFLPRVAWTFATGPAPAGIWDAVLRYAEHLPAPDLRVGADTHWAYGHDWRAMPKDAYFELMGEREILGMDYQPLSQPDSALVLSRDEFTDAVREALRAYTQDDALGRSPLNRCQVVREATWASTEPRLRAVLDQALAQLDRSEKDEHLHQAVHLTYCDPGRTQQQTAELLDLPFSTYRRHLAAGIERITEWLWERELNGYPPL